MISARHFNAFFEVFDLACQQFESLINAVYDESTADMEHGEVERLISQMGNELLRRVMQAHLDLRALREPRREDLTGVDGSPLTRCRENCTRNLTTIFGDVVVKRKGYRTPGTASQFPLDRELNLSEDKYSHGLRYRIAEEVALHSFDDAVANIKKTTGGKVPKRQGQQIMASAAQDFEAFYTKRKTEAETTRDILVMSVDQKGVVMHREDLRAATRKAAEQQVQPPGACLSPGEKPNRKRMATVAAVYSIEPHQRSPERIMQACSKQDRSDRPRARNKRVWASVEQGPEKVIQAMLDEALQRDPEKKRPWVVLLDGAEKQLDLVLDLIHGERSDVTIILDFIHVLEYVWKAAFCLYEVGRQEAGDWVGKRALQILQGQALHVAAEIRHDATIGKLLSNKRKVLNKCANYIEKYEVLMDYQDFLAQGLPIATGVIEGACRHLIKDRMELTGARWRLKSAEAVLKIRSLRSSGDFESYWTFHQAQEQERNYSPTLALDRAA